MCTPEQLHVIEKAEAELLEEYGVTGAGALRLMAMVLGEIECLRYSPEGVLDAFALMTLQRMRKGEGLGFREDINRAHALSRTARELQAVLEDIADD
jgi:hypothetical protein